LLVEAAVAEEEVVVEVEVPHVDEAEVAQLLRRLLRQSRQRGRFLFAELCIHTIQSSRTSCAFARATRSRSLKRTAIGGREFSTDKRDCSLPTMLRKYNIMRGCDPQRRQISKQYIFLLLLLLFALRFMRCEEMRLI